MNIDEYSFFKSDPQLTTDEYINLGFSLLTTTKVHSEVTTDVYSVTQFELFP